MKLSEYAKREGISYTTAWRWWKNGLIQGRQAPTGTILVDEPVTPTTTVEPENNGAWVYARVSTHTKKDDLERQAQRISEFCNARGWTVEKVVKEVASGMNDNRTKLNKLLNDPGVKRIVVENKDRLTRFGFNYIDVLLTTQGREVIVMNQDDKPDDDLMKDLVAVITSFCCRLYGMRRGSEKAAACKKALK